MTIRDALALTLLGLAVVASWWWLRDSSSHEVNAPADAVEPGYYLSGARVRGLDDQGAPLYELTAERIRQLPGDGSIELVEPRFGYAPQADIPWTLQADSGRIPADGDTIELHGNVQLASLPAERESAIVVYSEHFRIAVREQRVSTDTEVAFIQDGQRLEAGSLDADLAADQLRLAAGVSGRFVR